MRRKWQISASYYWTHRARYSGDFSRHPLHIVVKNGLTGPDDPNRVVIFRIFKFFSDNTMETIFWFKECAKVCDKEQDIKYFNDAAQLFEDSMDQFRKEIKKYFDTVKDNQWKAVQEEPVSCT